MRFFVFFLLLVLLPSRFSGAVAQAAFVDAARPEAMIAFFATPPTVEKNSQKARMPDVHDSIVRASWYGGGERLSAYTASGARFYPWALTAAHRSLPFGARLLVSHAGRSAVVTITDRGPAAWTGRSLDLSRGAARAIGIERAGAAAVRVSRLP